LGEAREREYSKSVVVAQKRDRERVVMMKNRFSIIKRKRWA
jgi:hypothetical protein